MVTALHRQGNCNPVDPSSYFHANDAVWVFVILKQPAKGHTISVRWFANGTDVNPPSIDKTTLTLGDNNAGACFSLQYPSPGKGMVKVYWDRPANDTGNDPTDPALMATISFAVLPHRVWYANAWPCRNECANSCANRYAEEIAPPQRLPGYSERFV